ncbi:MAG TPA: DUF1549 and DUF1553 domain-containing protein [Pirellulaceae bacterium]|nr:DUF1549 and DUF1553 domain-containing protein [Pirellulaceae bacterium]
MRTPRIFLGLLVSLLCGAQPLEAAPPRDPLAMAARIDELLAIKLDQAKTPAIEAASDAEFLRRAYLDLTGRIPRVSETRAFLKQSDPQRRLQLVDQLLERPTHSTHLAQTWQRFLLPEGADVVRFGGARDFELWLRQQFSDNRPYDAVVREVILASGPVGRGPTLFYTALENKPEELAAATSRSFLGVQIQCAQCHDHPHDKWKQDDFWGYAAFFARLEKPGGMQQVTPQLRDTDQGEVEDPRTKLPVAPRYLLGRIAAPEPNQSRRQQLATWLTANENPYFAAAAVNRSWALLFGRGLVEPIDDLGEHNPPSHPELWQELAAYFQATNYDLRNLLRVLASTEAYGRTSLLRDGETPTAPELFARMALKPLTAEQLYDCLAVATCKHDLAPPARREVNSNIGSERAMFLDKFRGPASGGTEYHAGIPQALTLMNGALIGSATDVEQSAILRSIDAPFFTEADRIETLFLATLSRPPSADESAKFVSYLESELTEAERRRALSDVLWALLNSAEFVLNH